METLRNSSILGIDMLIELHQYCFSHPDANTASVLEAFREHPHAEHLANLLATQLEEKLNIDAEYIQTSKRLLRAHFNARLDELTARANLPGGLSNSEQKELTLLLKQR